MPMEADAPDTEFMRDLAMKKNAMSKIKASSATAAPKPDMHVLKHTMENSRTWARRPKTADIAARMRATI